MGRDTRAQVASVRRANAGDAAVIARIHISSWRAAYRDLLARRFLGKMSARSLTRRWARTLRKTAAGGTHDAWTVWVVEKDREVVGFAEIGPCRDRSLSGFAGEVHMLYLRPDRWGQGLGARLLERVLADLSERGYFWVVLWVLAGNSRARRFYGRHGLRPDGASRMDRSGGVRREVLRYALPLNRAW